MELKRLRVAERNDELHRNTVNKRSELELAAFDMQFKDSLIPSITSHGSEEALNISSESDDIEEILR